MSTRVELDQGALDELLHGEGGPVAQEITRRGIQVEGLAKDLCPVDTGRLRASITTEPGDAGGEFSVRIGTDVFYAIFQEFGTRYQSGTPFLRPALAAAG